MSYLMKALYISFISSAQEEAASPDLYPEGATGGALSTNIGAEALNTASLCATLDKKDTDSTETNPTASSKERVL